jgi:Tol biopolymer transport system component
VNEVDLLARRFDAVPETDETTVVRARAELLRVIAASEVQSTAPLRRSSARIAESFWRPRSRTRMALLAVALFLLLTGIATATYLVVRPRELVEIAFVRAVPGGHAIWVMRVDGTGSRLLTRGDAPSWSPDGKRVAFARSGPLRERQLYVISSDGSGLRQLTRCDQRGMPQCGFASSFTWSPDSRRIAFSLDFVNFTSYSGVYVTDADGSGLHRLARNAGAPSWSPDGKHIAFTRGNGRFRRAIWVMSADGRHQMPLSSYPNSDSPHATADDAPTWSPDGREIAFTRGSFDDPSDTVWVMRADGSGGRQVAAHALGRVTEFSSSSLAWSDDATELVYASTRGGVYSVQLNGGTVRRLTIGSADRNPAAVALIATTTASGGWKRFASSRYRYSVAYPPGWTAVKATTSKLERGFPLADGPEVDKLLSCGDSCPEGIDVVFYARKLSTPRMYSLFAAKEAGALANGFGCAPTSRNAARVARETAMVFTYSNCLGNYMVEYAVVHRGHGFDLYLLAPPGHEARDRATFARILSTFRFTP